MTPEDSEEESAPEPDPFAPDDDDEPLPPRQELHPLGQLAAGVLAVVVLIAAVLATSALLTAIFR